MVYVPVVGTVKVWMAPAAMKVVVPGAWKVITTVPLPVSGVPVPWLVPLL